MKLKVGRLVLKSFMYIVLKHYIMHLYTTLRLLQSGSVSKMSSLKRLKSSSHWRICIGEFLERISELADKTKNRCLEGYIPKSCCMSPIQTHPPGEDNSQEKMLVFKT
jgi:hypothetical protein